MHEPTDNYFIIAQEVRGEIMDIIRQITIFHPIDTFLFGADWLLQRATQTPAADVQSKLVIVKRELFIIAWAKHAGIQLSSCITHSPTKTFLVSL